MYVGLLHSHSFLRYIVLLLLIVVIARSFNGWQSQKPFTKADDKLSLFLLISTHVQFLLGLLLYFTSSWVQFSGAAMKAEKMIRYWTVEHVTMMLIAVVLITVARSTQKKLSPDSARHKRLFILNTAALLIIVVAIVLSGRGFISI